MKRFLLLALCVIGAVQAAQPDLPTTLYGQVLHGSGSLAIGKEVTAAWSDTDGVQHTRSAKVLSRAEAENLGDPGLEGFYIFNQGFVSAAQGSQITITADQSSVVATANPGGAVSAPLLALAAVGGGGGKGGSPGSGSSGKGTGEATPGKPTDPTPWDGTGDSSGSPSSGEFVPPLPTAVFGQLLDDEGQSLGGEEVYAEWYDQQGNKHNATATTLTKKQAKALGNKSLEGFYAFNKGDILAAPETDISIYAEKGDVQMTSSKPGKTVSIEDITVYGNPIVEAPILLPVVHRFINISVTFFVGSENSKRNQWISYTVIFILVVVPLAIVRRSAVKKSGKLLLKAAKRSMYIGINHMFKTKAKRMMTKQAATLSGSQTLYDAVDLMVHHKLRSIFITRNNKLVGKLNQQAVIMASRLSKKLETIKIADVMIKSLKTVPPTIKTTELVNLLIKHGIHDVAVAKNTELIGKIGITDILKALYDYSLKNEIDSPDVPTVRSIASKKLVIISKNEVLSKAREMIIKYNVDFLFVIIKGAKKPSLGMITREILINELFKNPNRFNVLTVESTMIYPLLTVKPSLNVFETNKVMLDMDYPALGVISYEGGVSIVTQAALLYSMHDFLSSIAANILENQEEAVVLEEKSA